MFSEVFSGALAEIGAGVIAYGHDEKLRRRTAAHQIYTSVRDHWSLLALPARLVASLSLNVCMHRNAMSGD